MNFLQHAATVPSQSSPHRPPSPPRAIELTLTIDPAALAADPFTALAPTATPVMVDLLTAACDDAATYHPARVHRTPTGCLVTIWTDAEVYLDTVLATLDRDCDPATTTRHTIPALPATRRARDLITITTRRTP